MKFIATYLALVLLFAGTLVLATLIPTPAIHSHITQSLPHLTKEGQYPTVGLSWRPVVLDNYTDALILNTQYSLNVHDATSPFRGERKIRQGGELNQITNLQAALAGSTQGVQYERYWHGYLLPLRVALIFGTYTQIRIFLTVGLLILVSVYLWHTYKRWGLSRAIAACIAFAAVDFWYVGLSLQFSAVFLIGLVAGIYLLRHPNHPRLMLVFFVIGGVTAYVDLLTAPLLTLSLILIACDIKSLQKVLQLVISWGGGYALLWATKWILAELVLGPGPLTAAYEQVRLRATATEGFDHLQLQAIMLNLKQLIGYHKVSKIVVISLGLMLSLILLYTRKVQGTPPFQPARIFLLLLPYMWYTFAANHSVVHVWFTYRSQFLTVFVLMLSLCETIDWTKVAHVKKACRKFVMTMLPRRISKNQQI